ncbi:MAG: molybdate ABC transporter substrate-binding protein [Vicinamibacterales bacterium]
MSSKGQWHHARRLVCAALACAFVLVPAVVVRAQSPTRVAAASSMNFALKEIAEQFGRDRGERVDVVFGASGTLTRQIQDGAPFELFLAADEEFPRRLAAAGLTRDAGTVYAIGRLALFAPTNSPLTVDSRMDGLANLLAAGGVRRFAMANPEVAPYGRAAEAALRKRGLWDRLRRSLVLGDTIAQAAQFATTGNAVGGLVAYSLVVSPELANRGTYALIAASEHEPLRQRMVLLKNAGSTAQHFYQYLQEPAARSVLRRFGFEVPQ